MNKLKEEKWKLIYDKNNLTLKVSRNLEIGDVISNLNKYSFNNEFLIIKTQFKLDKSLNTKEININNISKFLYDPIFRLKWDKNIKEYAVYDQLGNSSKNRGVFFSPIFFISERKFKDKKIDFFFKKTHNAFSSTIKGEENSSSNNTVRITNFINTLTVTDRESHYEFIGYNQFDNKIKLPDFILNITILSDSVKWYRDLLIMINSTDLNNIK